MVVMVVPGVGLVVLAAVAAARVLRRAQADPQLPPTVQVYAVYRAAVREASTATLAKMVLLQVAAAAAGATTGLAPVVAAAAG